MAKKAKMAKIAKIVKSAKITEIAETEIVLFLKTFKIWVFLKKRWVFRKKHEFYSKSLRVANLLQNAYQVVYFLKISSALFMRFFGKDQKTLNVGKFRNYDEERVFFSRKKLYLFLKAIFTKMGRRKISRW